MPTAIGSFVEPDGGVIPIDGKPDIGAVVGDSIGTQGPDREPEILSGFETYNPSADTARVDTTDQPVKRRGRKPGSKNRVPGSGAAGSEKEAGSGSLIDLTVLLLSIHNLGAALTGVMELQLADEEAKRLADGIKEVNKYYGIGLDPKKLAIVNLGIVMAEVYGTRFMAYRIRIAKETKEKPKLITLEKQPPASQSASPRQQPQSQPKAEKVNGSAGLSPADIFGFEAPHENNTF